MIKGITETFLPEKVDSEDWNILQKKNVMKRNQHLENINIFFPFKISLY